MSAKAHHRTTFGAWLDAQLQRREWNQSEFARRIDVRPGVVSHWIRGERVPEPRSIDKIADVLFVDVDELLTIAGHRPRLPMDHLERWHAELDPLLKQIPLNEENVFNMRIEAERILRVREMRAGKGQGRAPVELGDEEE
jgi:transcriptional regulator with XRE-family HTH domain